MPTKIAISLIFITFLRIIISWRESPMTAIMNAKSSTHRHHIDMYCLAYKMKFLVFWSFNRKNNCERPYLLAVKSDICLFFGESML